MSRILLTFLALSMLLAACSPPAYPPPVSPVPTMPGNNGAAYPGGDTSVSNPPVILPTQNPYPVPGGPVVTVPANPYAPQPQDTTWVRGQVYLDSSDVLVAESYPVQVTLQLSGNLPTPCHQLRIAPAPADTQRNIYIEVYSVSEPGGVCVQVLEPFSVSLPLGSFAGGKFIVYINGEKAAEIDG